MFKLLKIIYKEIYFIINKYNYEIFYSIKRIVHTYF